MFKPLKEERKANTTFFISCKLRAAMCIYFFLPIFKNLLNIWELLINKCLRQASW